MKKLIVFILSFIILCGCSLNKLPNDNCEFLTKANWEGNDGKCVNVISFDEDKTFSNWCYCGSPIGDGDLVETFTYDAKNKSFYLLDSENEIVEIGEIKYVDDMYLVVNVWDKYYVYENIDEVQQQGMALEYVHTNNLTKPYLHILSYENNILTVSSYDYDGDMSSEFDKWEFKVSKNVEFKNIIVNIENQIENVEVKTLEKEDYENIGEFYTTGYLEINDNGEVERVVFYGETITE